MKLLHFADTHLGMENYGRTNPQTGLHTRFEDGLKCLAHIVDTAIARQVDAAIFAGDAYRSCDPNPTHQDGFVRQMRRFHVAGIPLVMIPGNHDMPVAWGKKTSISVFDAIGGDDVYVFNEPAARTIETRSGPLAVAAFPWPTRAQFIAQDEFRNATEAEITDEIVRAGISSIAAMAMGFAVTRPDTPSILVAHLMADKSVTSGSEYYSTVSREPKFPLTALALPQFDYVALGHVHNQQDLNKGTQPPVVYTGSMDRINFGEAKDVKGFCIVDIHGKGNCSYEFLQTPTRPFRVIDVVISDLDHPTEAILRAVAGAAGTYEGGIVRVEYDVAAERAAEIDVRKIEKSLDAAWLVDSIAAKPRPITERESRSELTESIGWQQGLRLYGEVHPEIQNIIDQIEANAARIEAELLAVK